MKRVLNTLTIASLVALPIALHLACGGNPPKPVEPPPAETTADAGVEDAAPPPPKTLIERLGGKDTVKKVAKSFTENMKANATLKKLFTKLPKPKQEAFEKAFGDQLCDAVGGGCGYEGKSFKEVFKGMKITDKEWDEVAKELGGALGEKENGVSDTEKTDVLDIFGKAKDEVVEAKKDPKKK
jgi:truncated hemoglobin YjbI